MKEDKKGKDSFGLIKEGAIRTRFAPSPTGSFHMGNARTALFNFLFARNQRGRVILRIENTDRARSTQEHEESLIKTLKQLGIDWDEGPDIGGSYGPYRQSERSGIYEKYLKELLEQGSAYYCFCSKEDLITQKQYLMSLGKPPIYDGKCRELSKKEVQDKVQKGESYIIRFKGQSKKIVFKDLVKGEIEIDTSLIGDFSLAKDLKSPLYNCACVIDDFEMKISHVIRGDDHISNTPKQIVLYEAWKLPIPVFGHLPMVLAPDKSKLSKRKHGNVAVEDFEQQGYLPEALVNFIAFLGWNPGTKKEVYSMASLIKDFSIERVRKSGSIFNIKRLDYLNGFYIRQKSKKALTKACIPYLLNTGLIQKKDEEYIAIETGERFALENIEPMVALYQERLKKLSEIPEFIDFFFKKELKYEKELLLWKDQKPEEMHASLDRLIKVLSRIENHKWSKENLEKTILDEAEKFGLEIREKGGRGYLLWPLRIALTGKKASAGPFEIAEVMGKEKTLNRIEKTKYV